MAIRLAVCCLQIAAVQAQNQELQACVSEIERHKATMTHQMFTLREKWTEATEENVKLRDEVASLRQHLQVHCTVWFVLLESMFAHHRVLYMACSVTHLTCHLFRNHGRH